MLKKIMPALGALSVALMWAGLGLAQTPAPSIANQPAGHETLPPAPAPAAGAATPAPAAAAADPTWMLAKPITRDVNVSNATLRNADADQDNWLLHGRTHDSQRFSPLTQINRANVKRLRPAAIIQTGNAASFETTPVVVNGVMYVSSAGAKVQAFDAVTGEIYWTFTPELPKATRLCCGLQNRGVVAAYGKVYVAMLDATIQALDAKTGKPLWRTDPDTTLPAEFTNYFSYTTAPQVYDGMVVVGAAGAEYPTRGFVQAYDAETGKVLWRFRTTAAPDEPGGNTWKGEAWKYGGGSVWNTPSVDLKNNILSFATGNPNPDIYGVDRTGDNHYTSGMVGVDAKTGAFRWFHQQVPHDIWDYDSASPAVLFDAKDANGRVVPAAAEANKNGFVDIVNRLDGTLLRRSEAFVLQSATFMQKPPTGVENRIIVYPASNGGSQWSPPAYSPRTHELYVLGVNEPSYYSTNETAPFTPGGPVNGQIMGGRLGFIIDGEKSGTIPISGTLSAVNVDTGKIDWQYKAPLPMVGGALATASDLVFAGELDGWLSAFDAKTGEKLWKFYLGAPVGAPPITYRVNGVQYVAVAAGGLSANSWPRVMTSLGKPSYGDVVAIFAIPD